MSRILADDGINQPLTVGMELNYPPFETEDANGQPSGMSVDLATALGQYLHRPVKILNMPFESLIVSLKTNRIDLIISSLTITPERAQSIDFSDPYCQSGLALLLKKETPCNSIDDLNKKGVMVAVKLGTTGDVYASQHLTQATVLRFQQASACALEVIQGRADAFIYDQLSVNAFHERFPAATRMNLRSFQEEPWGMGVAKNNIPLRAQVNSFLADFRAHGGFDLLRDKYFKEDEKVFQANGIPFYF